MTMTKRTRRNHAPAFETKGTLGREGEKTLAELPQQFDVQPNQIITAFKAQLVNSEAEIFATEPKAGPAAAAIDVNTLHAEISELTLINGESRKRT